MNGKDRDTMNLEIRQVIREYKDAIASPETAPGRIDDLGDNATILFSKLSYSPVDYQESCKHRVALIAKLAAELREIVMQQENNLSV